MAEIITSGDVGLLSGKVAVIGYGSQGHAHALNLHESGVKPSRSAFERAAARGRAAEEAGLTVRSIPDAVQGAQLVAILLPDQHQPQVYEELIAANLAPGCSRCCSRTASASTTSASRHRPPTT